jgi:hypothetical protein
MQQAIQVITNRTAHATRKKPPTRSHWPQLRVSGPGATDSDPVAVTVPGPVTVKPGVRGPGEPAAARCRVRGTMCRLRRFRWESGPGPGAPWAVAGGPAGGNHDSDRHGASGRRNFMKPGTACRRAGARAAAAPTARGRISVSAISATSSAPGRYAPEGVWAQG